MMETHCLVASGVWRCSPSDEWDFIIDKTLFSRMMILKESYLLSDLKERALQDFGQDSDPSKVSFTYWLPTQLPLSLKLPPVQLTTDEHLAYFFKLLKQTPSMNLFVTFPPPNNRFYSSGDDSDGLPPSGGKRRTLLDSSTVLSSETPEVKKRYQRKDGDFAGFPPPPDDSNGIKVLRSSCVLSSKTPQAFNTPNNVGGRQHVFENGESSGAIDFWRDDLFTSQSTPPAPKKTPFIAPSTTKFTGDWSKDLFGSSEDTDHYEPWGSLPDQVLVDHVKDFESRNHRYGKDVSQDDGFDTESFSSDSDVGDVEVRDAGYDTVFWSPLVEEPFGGSDVVETLCAEPISREYLSTGSGVFDHRVVTGAQQASTESKPNMDRNNIPGGTPRMATTPVTGGNPRMASAPVVKRNLKDIDDEEFDIPPLFDDVEFVRGDIPDLDRDDEDDDVYVGKLYRTKVDCQIALAIYAIREKFYFKQTRTKKDYFVCSCADPKCDWRIFAKELPDTRYYKIKKACLEHTCDTDTKKLYMKKATNRVLASVYKAKFTDPVFGPKPMDLQQLILEDLRISTSYLKCWRVTQTAAAGIRGSEPEQYAKLPQYLKLLKETNPGTVACLETEPDIEGRERFLYLFLAFGASIKGFRNIRPVLVLDGTHLSGMYKGVLLTASGQDANFQVYPLAFAVVDSENDDAWTWFLMKLERIIADSPSLTIISDRCISIYNAKARIFPKAHHGCCLIHLQRNVNTKFKSQGLVKLVGQAAMAFRVGTFQEYFRQIRSESGECSKFLDEVGIAHWSRSYFRGDRYNLMTSNIAESLNKALLGGRSCPIIDLLMFIRSMMTRWFNARRTKSRKHGKEVPPEVDKQLQKTMNLGKGIKIGIINKFSVEVVAVLGKRKWTVDLIRKKCTCKVYDKTRLPCTHALLAADAMKHSYASCVYPCHKTKTWQSQYDGSIYPEADVSNHETTAEDDHRVVYPPTTKRPPGRPKKCRIPSTGDFPGSKPKKESTNRCSRCQQVGHNRTTCKSVIT